MIAGEGTHTPMTPPLTLSSLPLFPLGSVLFPDGVLALRVFEGKRSIDHALALGCPLRQ